MSNFPHSTSLATSLSTSPYAVQSNLEALIQNARTHPNPRRASQSSAHYPQHPIAPFTSADSPGPDQRDDAHASAADARDTPASRRQSELHHLATRPRIGTIREASYNEGAAIMLDDSDDDENTNLLGSGGNKSRRASHHRRDSRASRVSRNSAASRRHFGGTSDPVGMGMTPAIPLGDERRASDGTGIARGTSRTRATARTPPRKGRMSMAKAGEGEAGTDGDGDRGESADDYFDFDPDHAHDYTGKDVSPGTAAAAAAARGRATDSRPISRSSSPLESTRGSVRGSISYAYSQRAARDRRMSVATTRFADDSSGDEGGDVARGLVGTGGTSMLGVKGGNGMMPGHAYSGGGNLGIMDADPAEELMPEDLEVPVGPDGMEVRDWTEALRAEMAIVIRSSVPVFTTQAAEWSLVLASVISIGHQGTTQLAASSLASMTASVSSFSILQGLATAMDTLLPAAWASSDPSRVGLWTQRMAVVLAFSTIPMYVLWWNAEGILLSAGQDPDVSRLAASYLRYLSIGIPGYGGTIVVKKYLQAQNLMKVPTYVLFIVSPLNVFFNYLLVWGPAPVRIGFNGGAIATAISYTLNFLLLLIWAVYYGPKEAKHPVEFRHMFAKLGTVTSLGLAGTIMVSSEWWAWEACALAASLLGPTNLAAQSVLLSTTSTLFQVPAALGIASGVRVGNLLGAGRGWEAKWASRACLFLSVAFATINCTMCFVFRKNWGYLFNNDAEVVHIVATIMPYIGLFQITDGVAATAGSVLRALGLHTTGALINMTSYYVIGLPFGLWLTFTPKYQLGLIGLWIGLSIALGYASIVSFIMVWRTNWPRAVERVRERLGLPALGQMGEDGKWEGHPPGDDADEDGDVYEYGDEPVPRHGHNGRRYSDSGDTATLSPKAGNGERRVLLNGQQHQENGADYGAARG